MKKALSTFAVVGFIAFASVNASAAVNHPIGVTKVAAGKPMAAPPPSNGFAAGLTITGVSVGNGADLPFFSPPYVGLPYLLDAVAAGSSIVTSVSLQSTIYTGEPTVNYEFVQGGTVLSSASVTFSSDFLPGYVGLAYFPETAPSTKGPSQILVTVYNGTTLIATQVYLVDIY
jgi:hypothetical protein